MELTIMYDQVSIHSVYNYQEAIIILSDTHWCNLNSVKTLKNVTTLTRYSIDSLG